MESLKDLAPNPKNPRAITDVKLEFLERSLKEYGNLDGVIYNVRSKQLCGGHQRRKVFPKDAKITIVKRFKKPTQVGTVAIGYILVKGERHSYREVDWDPIKEKAANIAANKGAGDWDLPQLGEWLKEIDSFGFDLDLTLFDEEERKAFLQDTNFAAGNEDDQGQLDEKSPVECPKCGHEFVP